LIAELEKTQFVIGPQVVDTGVSISVIKDRKVVLNTNYGLRDRRSKLSVTDETIFPIASITKSFTAASLLQCMREKKISIDTEISKIWRKYRLSSEEVSSKINVIDLLAHRCGFPRHDFLWYSAKMMPEEIFRRLKDLDMNPPDGSGFRETFQYNNISYLAAGEFLAHLSGKSWSKWVEDRILTPANLSEVWIDYESTRSSGAFALPYVREMECPIFDEWTTAPAASMFATARGLAEWLVLQMDNEQVIIDAEVIEQMSTPHTSVFDSPEGANSIEVGQYGLGQFVDQLHGRKLIHHGGSIVGLSAFAGFCPDDGIGVVVLVNQTNSRLARQGGISILSHLMNLPAPKMDKFPAKNPFSPETMMPVFTRTSQWISKDGVPAPVALIGTYENLGYGRLEVKDGLVKYGSCEWPILEVHSDKMVIGVDWIGMNCAMVVQLVSGALALPLNLHPGTRHVVFDRC
jgi:CubicO group peptidase (beta-lactamase class C family)